MKLKLKLACAAALAVTAMPALALQLGDIQVRSALNQPLVAAIPLHPKNLTELDGLSVSLAPAQDFARAGLQVTPTDQTLQFHVVTDNNGQKLILVTSSQPVTDPYLDFLVQVNTRDGKQVREFVVLLNPVIAAPAPAVQPAAAPPASAPGQQPAQLPPSSQFPQPQVSGPPVAKPAAQPAPPASRQPAYLPTRVNVRRGDTLSGIAHEMVQGSDVNLDQMMLALKAANPDAFFKDNINNLKAGAILRIPTRELIDQRSVAAAAAEVRRQNESWRSARPHPATVVEGTAAQAAANAAPRAGNAKPTSDHLTLAPPTGEGGGANNRPGVAGGTGKATVTGLRQQLQANRDTLVSLNQSNADLESRVQSLKDIAAKSQKLLSLKDATIADLQHRLGALPPASAPAASVAKVAPAASGGPVASTPHAAAAPWYMRPVTWIVAALVVLGLVLLGLLGRRKHPALEGPARGPLADPDDVSAQPEDAEAFEPEPEAATTDDGGELAGEPEPDEPAAAAEAMREPDPELEPQAEPEPQPEPEPEPEPQAWSEPVAASESAAEAVHDHADRTDADAAAAAPEPAPAATPMLSLPPSVVPLAPLPPDEDAYVDDPVDTKLDLARAYLDMDDPDNARAMLHEVLEEGTQVQKDTARRLLADTEG